MIGKAEWFRMRKYGGWGIRPATKEGWIYIGVVMIPFLLVSILPLEEKIKTIVTWILMVGLLVEITEIMIRMKKDEREEKHEAIAERNASWFMLTIILLGFFYRTIEAGLKEKIYVDPILATVLLGGAMVKGVTFWRLRKK